MHRVALGAFGRRRVWRPTCTCSTCHNAPFGARCFMTRNLHPRNPLHRTGYNAPFGARCFMTQRMVRTWEPGPNAPFGARCFMTGSWLVPVAIIVLVLMRRLVLGALCRLVTTRIPRLATSCLNAPFGAGRFMTLVSAPTSRTRLASCLNALVGARCFMTCELPDGHSRQVVSMRRLALGA